MMIRSAKPPGVRANRQRLPADQVEPLRGKRIDLALTAAKPHFNGRDAVTG